MAEGWGGLAEDCSDFNFSYEGQGGGAGLDNSSKEPITPMWLGKRLYIAYWKRNHNEEHEAPDFEFQAPAIQNMWVNIAFDALKICGFGV